ncbi:hypothetical protein MTR_4g073015 [Medicago truncatula]|uniref:Uncharacterized protein n=1 Tax=Medicago truncatula TaxID=3880 RepID=A0A072ULB6_MEDTR|nr:hypothetical protein MTR_4g073015 [Medicago truncatula]
MAIELELFSFPLFVIKEIVKGNDAELENPAVHVANNSIAQGIRLFVYSLSQWRGCRPLGCFGINVGL